MPTKKKKKTVKKTAEQIAKNISADILKAINPQIKKSAKKKMKKMKKSDIQTIDRKVNLFTLDTKRAQDAYGSSNIQMKESQVKLLKDWFIGFCKMHTQKDGGAQLRKAWEGLVQAKMEPLNITTNADGGFLVPTLLHNALIPLLEDLAQIKPRCTVIDMTGMKASQLNLSGILSKPRMTWTAESAQKSSSSMQFNQINLTPYVMAAIIPITKQLISDSPFNIVSIVTKAFAEAIAKEEDRIFILGAGTTQPTGIDAYTLPLINAAGALSFQDFNTAYFRLPQAYRNSAVWIMNSRTMAAVANFQDSQNRPLLIESYTEAGLHKIKGKPVIEQNDMASSKIFFIDLKQYFIGQKWPISIDIADQAVVSGRSSWERNEIFIRAEERIDGELTTVRAGVEIENTGVS